MAWHAVCFPIGLMADRKPTRIALPTELGIPGTGYYIQGTNTSDDLFMFLTRRLTSQDGIEPNVQYLLDFNLTLASDAPSNAIGSGGAGGTPLWRCPPPPLCTRLGLDA